MSKQPAESSQPEFISEEEAHLVLARAVDLDSRMTSDVSIVQLQAIAEEAGISSDALDRALSELHAGSLRAESATENRPLPLSHRLQRYRHHVTVASTIGFAFVTRGDHGGWIVLGAVAVSALFDALIRIVEKRERGSGPSGKARTQERAIVIATNDYDPPIAGSLVLHAPVSTRPAYR